jgi:hypothetical protein
MNNEQIQSVVEANKLILEDILSNDSFQVEDLLRISKNMEDLIENLHFWLEQDNSERFFYELKNYMNWLLDNFS